MDSVVRLHKAAPLKKCACVGEAANETPLFVYYQRCRPMLGAEAHGHVYSGQQG